MKKSIEQILGQIFFVLAILMFVYLTGFSFLFSWVNKELADENVYFSRDSIIGNIVAVVVIGLVFYVQKRLLDKKTNIKTKPIALAVAALCTIISLCWVLTSGTAPFTDQRALCEAASDIAKGNYIWFEKGEYLARYPHQLSLVTIHRVLFALFGDNNYTAYRVVSALTIFLLVYSGYVVVSVISNKNTVAEIIFLEIATLCFPMYLYTDYVYGEIPSASFIMASVALVLCIFKKPSIIRYSGLWITVFFAMMYRKNSLVAYIAVLGVALVKAVLGNHRKQALSILLVVLTAIAAKSLLINSLYKSMEVKGVDAIPSILWVSMGTNGSGNFAGWYDGSSLIIFRESDYDADVASERAKEILGEFYDKCKADPKFCAKFYTKKTSSQWSAPMYQCVVMNNNIVGEQTKIAKWIYDEKNWKYTDAFMNIYQLCIYGGVLLFLFFSFKKIKGLEQYIGLIAVYGGFLFSIIWEAKTRYILPYFLIMLPYAALGINELVNMKGLRDEK